MIFNSITKYSGNVSFFGKLIGCGHFIRLWGGNVPEINTESGWQFQIVSLTTCIVVLFPWRCWLLDGGISLCHRRLWRHVSGGVQQTCSVMDGQYTVPNCGVLGHAVHRSLCAASDLSDFGEIHLHCLPISISYTQEMSNSYYPDSHLDPGFWDCFCPADQQRLFQEFLWHQRGLFPTARRADRDSWGSGVLCGYLPRWVRHVRPAEAKQWDVV